jgi:predicted nucleic acid-binding protein
LSSATRRRSVYLVLIGRHDILPQLYQAVHTSQSVLNELRHPDAPPAVRIWATTPPPWLKVHADPLDADQSLATLHSGERTALRFAEQLRADIVLLDESAARTLANQRGLKIAGVLGVLRDAANADLLDLTEAIDRLRQTNFRASPELLKLVLSREKSG